MNKLDSSSSSLNTQMYMLLYTQIISLLCKLLKHRLSPSQFKYMHAINTFVLYMLKQEESRSRNAALHTTSISTKYGQQYLSFDGWPNHATPHPGIIINTQLGLPRPTVLLPPWTSRLTCPTTGRGSHRGRVLELMKCFQVGKPTDCRCLFTSKVSSRAGGSPFNQVVISTGWKS